MISLRELLTTAQVGVNITFRYAEYYAVAIIYYLIIVTIITLIQNRVEQKFAWSSRTRVNTMTRAIQGVSARQKEKSA